MPLKLVEAAIVPGRGEHRGTFQISWWGKRAPSATIPPKCLPLGGQGRNTAGMWRAQSLWEEKEKKKKKAEARISDFPCSSANPLLTVLLVSHKLPKALEWSALWGQKTERAQQLGQSQDSCCWMGTQP